MQRFDPDSVLSGKDEDARVQIARRAGLCLVEESLTKADRRAAELLARQLVDDAIEQVRCALSKAIRNAKHLPRDLALKLAHDVDSVSCPFLEVTEVFSDSDWQQLLLTIPYGARTAVARRSPMSEGIAKSLAKMGNSVVAETLIENPATPMTLGVCQAILKRFESEIRILDRLALRDDLIAEIAVKLTEHVSEVMRNKLVNTYKLPGYTETLAEDSETGVVLEIVRAAPEEDLISVAQTLMAENKLTPSLLLQALRKGEIAFFEAGLSVLTKRSKEHVRSVILRAGADAVTQLLKKAAIPQEMHREFRKEFGHIRRK